MWPAMQHPGISACWTDALFVSALQRSDDPSTSQVRNAIAAAVHEFGGQGCAEQVAQELATALRPRSFGCAGLARWPTRRAEAAPRGGLASARRHAPGRLDQAAIRPLSRTPNTAHRPQRRSPARAHSQGSPQRPRR